MSYEAELLAKGSQGYRLKEVPHTCAHCKNLEVLNESYDCICALGNFSVVPLGTCNYWMSTKDHNV